MTTEIEMKDLAAKQSDDGNDKSRGPRINMDADQEQAATTWAYAATILLLSAAIPMILFPSFLLYLSETGFERTNTLTPLESFLALHTGILLVAFALALLFNVPATDATFQAPGQNAQTHPLLIPLTSACTVISLLSYNTKTVGSLATLVFLGSSAIAAWGWWTVLFSGTSYISRKTGADKRTSRFLFGNKAAASSQKREWKKQQAGQVR